MFDVFCICYTCYIAWYACYGSFHQAAHTMEADLTIDNSKLQARRQVCQRRWCQFQVVCHVNFRTWCRMSNWVKLMSISDFALLSSGNLDVPYLKTWCLRDVLNVRQRKMMCRDCLNLTCLRYCFGFEAQAQLFLVWEQETCWSLSRKLEAFPDWKPDFPFFSW